MMDVVEHTPILFLLEIFYILEVTMRQKRVGECIRLMELQMVLSQ